MCFVHEATDRQLLRAEIEFAPQTLPPLPTPRPDLTEFQASATLQPMAQNISGLQVEPGSSAQTVRVTITSSDFVSADKETSNTLTTEVRLRN